MSEKEPEPNGPITVGKPGDLTGSPVVEEGQPADDGMRDPVEQDKPKGE